MDCSPPGSSVHGIFQARVLEWGAIAFSGMSSLADAKMHLRIRMLVVPLRIMRCWITGRFEDVIRRYVGLVNSG